MITQNRIEALIEQAENEEVEGDIQPVLERALTAGDLIKILQQFNPETPVELEIPVEFEGKSEMISEVGFVINVFESPGESTEADVITLRGCKPDLLEPYLAWEAEDTELN